MWLKIAQKAAPAEARTRKIGKRKEPGQKMSWLEFGNCYQKEQTVGAHA